MESLSWGVFLGSMGTKTRSFPSMSNGRENIMLVIPTLRTPSHTSVSRVCHGKMWMNILVLQEGCLYKRLCWRGGLFSRENHGI